MKILNYINEIITVCNTKLELKTLDDINELMLIELKFDDSSLVYNIKLVDESNNNYQLIIDLVLIDNKYYLQLIKNNKLQFEFKFSIVNNKLEIF